MAAATTDSTGGENKRGKRVAAKNVLHGIIYLTAKKHLLPWRDFSYLNPRPQKKRADIKILVDAGRVTGDNMFGVAVRDVLGKDECKLKQIGTCPN